MRPSKATAYGAHGRPCSTSKLLSVQSILLQCRHWKYLLRLVQFDSFTVEGALPVDTDGDFIPDDIDYSTQHIGPRNCSDMFARQTANLLGDMPQTVAVSFPQFRSGAPQQAG